MKPYKKVRINAFTYFCMIFLCLVCDLQISAQSPTTRGTEFWLGFVENLDLSGNGQPKFSFFVSCETTTSGAISLPATGYTQPFTAVAGQVTQIFLPAGVFYPIGSEQVEHFGIMVTSQEPITLGVQHHRLYFSDASSVLPLTELDSRYSVITHKDDSGGGGLSEFIIVATQNNTTVDIVPSVLTRMLKPPGVSITITLQKGEVYQMQSYEDLTGTSVVARAGKKIAIFSGTNSGTVQCNHTSHLYDQNFPVSRWGNEYVLIPFVYGYADVFRVLAQEDSTLVYNGCQTPVLLHRGQYHDFQSNVPFRITSSHPVAVGQFKMGQECTYLGDCTFMIHAPATFCSKHVSFPALQTAIVSADPYTKHSVNIVVRSVNMVPVYLDNNPVTFSSVSNSEFSYAILPLSVGSHTLISDSGFYASTAGFGQYDGYSFFLGYDGKYDFENTLSIDGPDTLCSGSDGKFSGISLFHPSSWSWNFGDETISNLQNPSHSYSALGQYTVSLLVVDSVGCTHVADYSADVFCADKYSECEVFVPTAFSPNNNGIDDYDCVYGLCIKELEYVVYNQWGQVVFKTKSRSECWDGKYKGQQLDNAVFAWTLSATLYSGKKITRTGNVTIIR
ncbi:MAG: PKD domain-containing protein [Bacteroidota bacterium]